VSLWSRKSLAACEAEAFDESRPRLPRSLGIVALTAFGVGSTVGAGIFSQTGEAAALWAGPAVSLSFVLASIACFFAGLCYAEFAAMVPIAGSAYSYAYVTLGEVVAWVIGWSLVLEWQFSASLVAISWSGYTTDALRDLGVSVPAALSGSPLTLDVHNHFLTTGTWIDLPAVLVVIACTVLMLAGTRTSSLVNVVIVIAKVLALLVLVGVGSRYVHPQFWHPFVPANGGEFGHFGWSGVARAAGSLFFAYIGFDGVSTLAEDARDPQRTVPWSVFASLVIVTLLYVGVSLVITGLASYHTLNVPDPLYQALRAGDRGVAWVRYLISIVAVVGLVSVVLASIFGQVRIFYSMARDGLMPRAFARLSPRRVPVAGTLWVGGIAAVTAGFMPLSVLADLISLGTLLAFTMVCVGILVLRHTAPAARRPFRTPWVPLVPVLGAVSCITLMLMLGRITWTGLAIWTLIGLAVYAAYGHRHSRLRLQALAAARASAAGAEDLTSSLK